MRRIALSAALLLREALVEELLHGVGERLRPLQALLGGRRARARDPGLGGRVLRALLQERRAHRVVDRPLLPDAQAALEQVVLLVGEVAARLARGLDLGDGLERLLPPLLVLLGLGGQLLLRLGPRAQRLRGLRRRRAGGLQRGQVGLLQRVVERKRLPQAREGARLLRDIERLERARGGGEVGLGRAEFVLQRRGGLRLPRDLVQQDEVPLEDLDRPVDDGDERRLLALLELRRLLLQLVEAHAHRLRGAHVHAAGVLGQRLLRPDRDRDHARPRAEIDECPHAGRIIGERGGRGRGSAPQGPLTRRVPR